MADNAERTENRRSGGLTRFFFNMAIGLVFWGVSGAWFYFGVLAFDLSRVSALFMVIRGAGVIGAVIAGVLGLVYFVRGTGKIHYAFGTQGWTWKFFLFIPMFGVSAATVTMILAAERQEILTFVFGIPMVLLTSFCTGRGLTRTYRSELVTVQPMSG